MIPKKFKILGHTIEVVIDNEYCHNNKCLGRFLEWDDKIILADRYKTAKTWRKYKPEIVNHTLKHEQVHAILYYMGEKKWLNEKFVDALAGLLHQMDVTVEY